MKPSDAACMLCMILFTLPISFSAHAESRPVLFENDPDLRSKVVFGMGYAAFKAKVGASAFGCQESPDKSVADITCKTSIKSGEVKIGEATSLFKDDALIAIIGKIDHKHREVVRKALIEAYNEQPQIVIENRQKFIFFNQIISQHLIWSRPDYLMMFSHADASGGHEKKPDFLMATESVNDEFIHGLRNRIREMLESETASLAITN